MGDLASAPPLLRTQWPRFRSICQKQPETEFHKSQDMRCRSVAADMPSDLAHGLFGRATECDTLDQLLDTTRAGQSGVLVLRGEAGAGKTALLDYVSDHAPGFRIE